MCVCVCVYMHDIPGAAMVADQHLWIPILRRQDAADFEDGRFGADLLERARQVRTVDVDHFLLSSKELLVDASKRPSTLVFQPDVFQVGGLLLGVERRFLADVGLLLPPDFPVLHDGVAGLKGVVAEV